MKINESGFHITFKSQLYGTYEILLGKGRIELFGI